MKDKALPFVIEKTKAAGGVIKDRAGSLSEIVKDKVRGRGSITSERTESFND